MTDNQFTFFIKTLQGERRERAPEVMARDANSVIAIGRNCMDFLASVGRFYNDERFIGPKGRIKAVQKEYEIRTDTLRKGFGKLIRKYWHHHSFPTADPKNKRLPISSENVDKLREAVLSASHSTFQRKRRYVMIKLLEITGGRRSEVAGVTVESVRLAAKMVEPMLKLPNAKRPGGREEYRYVPISRHDLKLLLEFIEKNRRRIVRKVCGVDNDNGYLLISETTGQKLQPNTITQEIHILAKESGIKEKICPHMFRHRFITKLFVALLEQHQIENEDDFRRALLDTEAMKQKIQQWTGHTNISSLDVYINLAFEEVANFKKTYNIVNTSMVIDSFLATLNQFREEIQGGVSPYEASLQLSQLVEAFKTDLDSAIS
jgi:site-specific recombinase XerD